MNKPKTIPYSLKRRVVDAYNEGQLPREIFDEIFSKEWSGMTFDTFRRKLRDWRKWQFADDLTEAEGTYPGMIAHAATVQVNGAGMVTQAWIKQTAEVVDWDAICEMLRGAVKQECIYPPKTEPSKQMLEIPIFDAHFGIAKLRDYTEALGEILDEIHSRTWEEIHIIVGQDNIHNNDLRGHTAKGTSIERVDIPAAWADAWKFWTEILRAACINSPSVRAHYSRGNHDECLSWAFFKALEAAFPTVEFDAALDPRKRFVWRRCFIGFGHLEYTTDSNKIFRDFVMDFPDEFAHADLREIHAGHLHRESIDNGMMIRRLASAVPTDEWSKANGFTGVHKRFQLFEYAPGRLRSIVYI